MIDKLITKVIFLSICIVIDHINSKQLLAREEETFGAEANPTRDTM
ncbi:MAG: hypothetical protein NG784_10130 [Candidatus Jettenia sp.]|nr:hypothetical protein [Candidatus Jettenia sp.]